MAVEQAACIWMDAGMIRYKLCDRDYDCEHCPLDAALSGQARPADMSVRPTHALARTFPASCRYTRGHTWVRPPAVTEDGWGFGIDAFAASILAVPDRVQCTTPATPCGGDVLCALAFGGRTLTLAAPFALRVLTVNSRVLVDPKTALRSPYDDGWLCRVEPLDTDSFLGLFDRKAIRELRDHDVRRYRRSVALALLDDHPDVGRTLPDGGDVLTDLRRILGAERYLELVAEFVH